MRLRAPRALAAPLIALIHALHIETEDYFKCFLLQGAVYRGLDAIDPIINVDAL